MSHEISGSSGRNCTKFSGLVELCNGLINRAFIWRSFKGRCYGNQFKTKNQRFGQTNLHCRASIAKRIRVLERRWASGKRIQCGYIGYKYGEAWFSNFGIPLAYFCTCVKKMVNNGISSRLSQNVLNRCWPNLQLWYRPTCGRWWSIWRSFWDHSRDVAMVT